MLNALQVRIPRARGRVRVRIAVEAFLAVKLGGPIARIAQSELTLTAVVRAFAKVAQTIYLTITLCSHMLTE